MLPSTSVAIAQSEFVLTIPKIMKGVQLTGHGGPEMLVLNHHIPTPMPKKNEVLVKVSAAGVNNTDINTRVGWYSKEVNESTDNVSFDNDVDEGGWSGALKFPLIQGSDLCGRVVALGENVTSCTIGSRVTCPTNQPNPTANNPTHFQAIGSEFDGAFAEYCIVQDEQVYDVSASSLSDIQIAALPCAYGTALNLLTRANVRAGDRVLVTGASGGVGLAAIELAHLIGAEVVGLASEAKQSFVLSQGANAVMNREYTPEPNSFDVVIDVVGGRNWSQILEGLVPGGRYAVSGAIAGPIVEADLRTIYLNDLTLFGCSFTPHEVFSELVKMVNDGLLNPLVSKVYQLEEIASAQADFASKKYPGKLVLTP